MHDSGVKGKRENALAKGNSLVWLNDISGCYATYYYYYYYYLHLIPSGVKILGRPPKLSLYLKDGMLCKLLLCKPSIKPQAHLYFPESQCIARGSKSTSWWGYRLYAKARSMIIYFPRFID